MFIGGYISYYYGNLFCYEIDINMFIDDWMVFWYYDNVIDWLGVVIMID